jgi:hypothetical protein
MRTPRSADSLRAGQQVISAGLLEPENQAHLAPRTTFHSLGGAASMSDAFACTGGKAHRFAAQ